MQIVQTNEVPHTPGATPTFKIWFKMCQKAEQYFRCWNTCLKLAWNVPQSTHTYILDNMLAAMRAHGQRKGGFP